MAMQILLDGEVTTKKSGTYDGKTTYRASVAFGTGEIDVKMTPEDFAKFPEVGQPVSMKMRGKFMTDKFGSQITRLEMVKFQAGSPAPTSAVGR